MVMLDRNYGFRINTIRHKHRPIMTGLPWTKHGR